AAHSIALNATSQIIVSGNNYYSGGSFGPEMMRSVSTTIKYQQPEFPVMVEKIAKPQEFKLEQNYPNPFNPSTKIHYQLPEDTQVSIVIYDVLGREVVTLVKDQMPAGQHNVVWEGRDSLGKMMCTGIYFCRMESVDYNKTIKMVYLR
ncbi:MAG: T9SS type A sorting domain-containing protein, partial [Candidatus Marinimicrobia bacterium]|nr:T9SS type A sorting domain-containing protein [Candidatus Neomarinimicrobiota bacterium]